MLGICVAVAQQIVLRLTVCSASVTSGTLRATRGRAAPRPLPRGQRPRRAALFAGGNGASNGLPERVAREEAYDPPGGNGSRGACLGVAADARPLGAHLPHVPKRRRITGSPCCQLALIVVRMASTAAAALAVVHPSSWAIRCIISAFLIVRCSVCVADVRRVQHQPSVPWTRPVRSSPGRRGIHTGPLQEASEP